MFVNKIEIFIIKCFFTINALPPYGLPFEGVTFISDL